MLIHYWLWPTNNNQHYSIIIIIEWFFFFLKSKQTIDNFPSLVDPFNRVSLQQKKNFHYFCHYFHRWISFHFFSLLMMSLSWKLKFFSTSSFEIIISLLKWIIICWKKHWHRIRCLFVYCHHHWPLFSSLWSIQKLFF